MAKNIQILTVVTAYKQQWIKTNALHEEQVKLQRRLSELITELAVSDCDLAMCRQALELAAINSK